MLLTRFHPAPSPGGMIWLAATFVAMLVLASGKRRTGQALDNPVLISEAQVTMVDAYLAGSVLVGLFFNAFGGWWWADRSPRRCLCTTECAKGGTFGSRRVHSTPRIHFPACCVRERHALRPGAQILPFVHMNSQPI